MSHSTCAIGPPPIPGARSASQQGRSVRPLLIWVRTGTAHAHLGDGVAFRLAAGEGAWIPAGNHCRITTEPGTVAFPLWLHPVAGSLTQPTRFEVPADWQDWLIQHFNLQVTPLSGRGYGQDAIADLLRRPGSRPPAPTRAGDSAPPGPLDLPVMPKSRGARTVAEELIRDPSLDLTVDQWAARALSSPRTLRRDFLADTGLTFERWRLRCRLSAAVDFLAAGYAVDHVGARIGFTSRNGFTRAFKQQFGPTPYQFSRRLRGQHTIGDPSPRVTAARHADELARMVHEGRPPVAPGLPPAHTKPHTDDTHVLSWVYRGSGYLDIGDRRYERPRGVATWIPAGVRHVAGLRQDSVSLPLANATTHELQLTEPLQARFPPAWDHYLMFCSISARSILRPDDYDPRHILDLFAEQVAGQRALSVPMPTDPQARTAAVEYLRRIEASGVSSELDVPAEVHRAFRGETGMSFARWRYAARMRIARDLLAAGTAPSAVSRRVGYRHLPTFSTAFARFHGLSPREYQEREAGTASNQLTDLPTNP